MPVSNNPYELLKVPRNASIQAIEDAYDRLFDRYEPKAQAGDPAAIDMLEALNEARDTLVDPRRRSALDRSLSSGGTATAVAPERPRTQPAQSRNYPPANYNSKLRARPRSRPVEVEPQRNMSATLPYFLVAAVLLFALAVAIGFLVNRGPAAPPADAVATVNGEPILRADYDQRVDKDKAVALNDPMFGVLFNNFEGITGTRALDLIKFDSLDKLINMQVIVQQARKEALYPTDEQINSLVNQAKQTDLASGITFEAFLKQHGITEERYRRAVVENVVYSVMANQHLPAVGTPEQRTDAFIKWICTTRQSYDVKILITFTVTDNPSCTSGLPSDQPLPGIDTTTPPEPEATAPAEAAPGSPADPTTQPTPEATKAP
ncbi:MAG: SurA N-terminal domain-containing protein [Chloroflexota bacterium]